MREFMRIVNHIGGEYSQWYIEIVTEFKELVSILYFQIDLFLFNLFLLYNATTLEHTHFHFINNENIV